VREYFDYLVRRQYRYGYTMARVVKWLAKQAMHGFQGVTGRFE